MKIIVMSDSHGAAYAVCKVVEKHLDADIFLHLGDGEREVNAIFGEHPEITERFYYLKGNCDSGKIVFRTENRLLLSLPFGHKIFAAHGDYFQVKYSTKRMVYEAVQNKADIVLYGHTHVKECSYDDGIYIINPGSLGCPRDGGKPGYAVLDVSEKGILANLITLD